VHQPYENPIPGPCQWSPVGGTPVFAPADEHSTAELGSPYFFRAEFLMWWIRGMNAPPLVSTGTLPPPPIFTGIQNPRVAGR